MSSDVEVSTEPADAAAGEKEETGGSKRRTRSTVDAIVDGITRAIRDGSLYPGQRLIMSDLMLQFGVSRGPIREALRRLSAEGMVTLRFNHAASVTMLSREEMRDLNEAREIVEAGAAALAAVRYQSSERKQEFEAIFAAMDQAAAEFARSTFLMLNTAFHDLLVAMAGNPVLREVWNRLHVQMIESQLRHFQGTDFMALAQEEHRQIIAALRAGDPSAAAVAMKGHLGRQTTLFAGLPDQFYVPEE